MIVEDRREILNFVQNDNRVAIFQRPQFGYKNKPEIRFVAETNLRNNYLNALRDPRYCAIYIHGSS
jgi:hypothetical protein